MSFESEYAREYDSFSGADYDGYIRFFEDCTKKYCKDKPVKEVLDLGCGTGEIALRLAKKGYDTVAADLSREMLSIAVGKRNAEDVLFIRSDMRELELYGTVRGALCIYDCINYLDDTRQIEKVFSLLHNYIEPSGIFVFDINTPYRFEKVFADNSFCFENEHALLVWQNEYSSGTRTNRMYLSLFEEGEDGKWERFDGEQKQRCFAVSTVERLLKKQGFRVCGIFKDFDFNPCDGESEKAFFVAVRE